MTQDLIARSPYARKGQSGTWGFYPAALVIPCMSFLLYGKSTVLDLAILAMFVVCCLVLQQHKCLALMCFPVWFFDYLLVLPFVGGTFNRIYAIIYLGFCFFDNVRVGSKRGHLPVALIYCAMGFMYSLSLTGIISSVLNVLTLFIVFSELESEENRHAILFSLGMSGFFCAIYAFMSGERLATDYGSRLSSAIGDPNFTSLLYIIGIFGVLCSRKIHPILKVFMIGTMGMALLLTVSQTGIIGFALLFWLYIFIKKPRFGLLAALAAVAGLILLINLPIGEGTLFYGIQQRLVTTFAQLANRDFNAITTGRADMWGEYLHVFFTKMSPLTLLFGGTDPTTKAFRDFYGMRYASHSSYVDSLFMVGVLGFLFVILWFAARAISLWREYRKTGDDAYLGLLFVKGSVIFFSLFLSFFSSKLFTLGFLL